MFYEAVFYLGSGTPVDVAFLIRQAELSPCVNVNNLAPCSENSIMHPTQSNPNYETSSPKICLRPNVVVFVSKLLAYVEGMAA